MRAGSQPNALARRRIVRGRGLRERRTLSNTAMVDLETLAFWANSSCVKKALDLSSRRLGMVFVRWGPESYYCRNLLLEEAQTQV